MIEILNPYVVKIIIAAKDKDSIRDISKKINESYGWTYKWILELGKIGAIKRKKNKVYINKKNDFYNKAIKFIKSSLKDNLNLSDAYLLPNLIGLDYIFTKTDAVFIWTKGGYNIARSKISYPIFIEILEKDKDAWEKYFSDLNLKYTFKNERKRGIYFIISLTRIMEKEFCEKIPVLPLRKTVEWAKKYCFNFEPALEMLDELYNLKLGIKYREAL